MTIEKNIKLLHFVDTFGFSEFEQKLISAAESATYNAYAPYSNFYVGAALLLDNGEIITGSNQENAAFPSGLCAERVALNTFGNMNISNKIIALAITARSEKYKIPKLLSPCGGCLQVMSEYVKRQNQSFKIFCITKDYGIYLAEGVESFLPFGFILD